MLHYKGFVAAAVYNAESHMVFGRVINCDDIITFYAPFTPEWRVEFRKNFEMVVDGYLEFSKEIDTPPAPLILDVTDPKLENRTLDFIDKYIDSI